MSLPDERLFFGASVKKFPQAVFKLAQTQYISDCLLIFKYYYVNINSIYGCAIKKCSKNMQVMATLVLHHHVLLAGQHLTSWLAPLHTNGSLETHNVTILVWLAALYYEAG